MVHLSILFIALTSSLSAAAPSYDVIPRADGSNNAISDDIWADTMQTIMLPDEEVCKLATSDPKKAAVSGRLDTFMAWWFTDRKGNMTNWPQLMYNNVTADSGKTPKVFYCADLGQENCNGDALGDCEDYNPSVFITIERQLINLWSTLKTLDYSAYKEGLKEHLKTEQIVSDLFPSSLSDDRMKFSTAALSLFMVCGLIGLSSLAGPLGWVTAATASTIAIGAITSVATINTIACGLIIGSNLWTDTVDRDKLQGKVNDIVYQWLDDTTSWAQNVTSKIFGSAKPLEADLWDFMAKVKNGVHDNSQKGRTEDRPDWQAVMYLLEDGQFTDPAATKEYADAVMDFGLQTMRLGIIREIMKAMRIIAVKFKFYDEQGCKDKFGDEQAFVDGACWIFWQLPDSPLGSKYIPDGQVAPNQFLSKTIGKYQVKADFMFKNVEECNNNKAEMDKSYEDLDYTDARVGECVFPVYYMHVCDLDYWKDGNSTLASDTWGLKLDNCKQNCANNMCASPTCTKSKCTT